MRKFTTSCNSGGNTNVKSLTGKWPPVLQYKLKYLGILVIYNKSMVEQNIFYYARPETADEQFCGMHIVLFGDFKQPSPLLDILLHLNLLGLRKNIYAAR